MKCSDLKNRTFYLYNLNGDFVKEIKTLKELRIYLEINSNTKIKTA